MIDDRDSRKLAGTAFGEALRRLASTNPLEVTAVTNASMKDGAIERLIAAFEDAAEFDDDGVEFWRARVLARLLEYADYRNFVHTVYKAKIACANTGQSVSDHFVDVTDMIEIGKGGEREIEDMRLTRYACYLTAQNGDSRKKTVAFAQTYFAIQTRRQELQEEDEAQYVPLSEDQKRLLLRDEIKDHKKKLASVAKSARVIDPFDFAVSRPSATRASTADSTGTEFKSVRALNLSSTSSITWEAQSWPPTCSAPPKLKRS